MARKPKPAVTPPPYPYKIPSIEYLKGKDLISSSERGVWHFFYIEGLLRSEGFLNLYKATLGQDAEEASEQFKLETGWDVEDMLRGVHHVYLLRSDGHSDHETSGSLPSPGVHDLQSHLLNYGDEIELREAEMDWINKEMLDSHSPYLWLRIDSRFPPTPIVNELKMMLQVKSKEYDEDLKKSIPEGPPYGKYATFDPFTWIDYLRCYDLRHCEAKIYGQIAMKVYGDSKKYYEVAEHGYKRVCKLIQSVESDDFPPPSNFLNKQ